MTTGKTIALTRWTFVGKVMSLLFHMLSRLVITFLPRSKHLFFFMAVITICSDFGAQKIIKSATVSTVSPFICHEVMGPDAVIFVIWMLSFFFGGGDLSHFIYYFFSFIFISWRLITFQFCSGFCHTLTWISHGVKWIPHPDPPSHLPPYPIPLGLPSAPGPSTCLMHPTWAGDLFHHI